jgi:hypothetical protein
MQWDKLCFCGERVRERKAIDVINEILCSDAIAHLSNNTDFISLLLITGIVFVNFVKYAFLKAPNEFTVLVHVYA